MMRTLPGNGWLDHARTVAVPEVAHALGLDLDKHGKSFGPCPACSAEHRHNPGREFDRRLRCRVTPEGKGWVCCSNGTDGCGAKGDAVQLVAHVLTGKPWGRGDADTTRTVRDFYASNGWCDPDRGGQPWTPPRPRAVRLVAAPTPRPRAAEVRELWARCMPVTADPEVAAWLSNRHDGPLDPAMVADLDLARALPADLRDLPRWAWCGGPWTDRGYRLIVQGWEADPDNPGRLRVASLHARNVLADGAGKGAFPAGCDAGGLVFTTGPDLAAHGLPLVELAEGVPDWLRLTLDLARLPDGARSAALGVVSGSADLDLAAAVPEGWTVAIRTHADKSGDQYAAKLRELLAPRGCKLLRQRKPNAGPVAVTPPADLDPAPLGLASWAEWTRQALDALASGAGNGEDLALVWRLSCDNCGGAARVPVPVADTHRRMFEALAPADLDLYRAQLRELGGDDAGQ